MRNARWLQALLFTAVTFGQTMIDLRTQSKSVDFSGAITTKPLKSGTTLPSTCGVGEMFYLTSAAPGANVYGCASQNAWSLESGGSILPAASGNSGKVITTDGTNYLWTSLGGDLGGQPGSAIVKQIQGLPVAVGTPISGQILTWTGSSWSPENVPSGDSTLPSATGNAGKLLTTDGTNYLWTALGGDLGGQPGSATVKQIQGLPVAAETPTTGQILTWTGSTWAPQNAPSGGGGTSTSGATMASQLGDFQVTRTNATTLAVGANCSAATPCNLRFGSLLYSFTSGATVSVTSGTGMAFVYVTSSGALTVGSSVGLSCSGCIVQSGVTATPPDSISLAAWAATNGSWNAAGLDERAFLSFKEVTNGPGITVAPDSQGHTVISADPNVVPLRTSAPASSSSACTPGSWANDTSFFYLCVNQNQWLRAALASF